MIGRHGDTMTTQQKSHRPSFLLLLPVALLATVVAAACGDDADTGAGATAGQGGSGAAGTQTGTTATGTTSSGAGGGTTSSASTGGAGGGETGCESDADCAGDPAGEHCDPGSGTCVECLPANDDCPSGQYCNAETYSCEVGCTDDADCGADLVCDLPTNACVGCLVDTDCPVGSVCDEPTNICYTGCSETQDCQEGFTCCGTSCFDVTDDAQHCGDCDTDCTDPDVAPENADAICVDSVCMMGACANGWADCNGISDDGCEHNVILDGDCVCDPGATQPCYTGAPGTEGIGPCAPGVQTCNAGGTSWGLCQNQVLPQYEVCANNVDDNCDGVTDNVSDLDGDGWTACNGDCCEVAGPGCSTPKLVNPGAFEVLDNAQDDDCDAGSSDTVPTAACSTVADFVDVTGLDVAQAMDICQTTTANPPLQNKKWGLITAQQLLANGNNPTQTQLNNMQDNQTAILQNYGTGGIVPRKGPTMAGMSSGKMRDENDPVYAGTSTSYASSSTPPAAYLAAHNNALPSSAGCSGNCPAGSGANDSVNVRLTIRVPTNAKSFSYDFRFVSSEYWTYSCTSFNDFYLALLQTGAPGIPADKNISFDALNNPVSVNNAFFDICVPKGCYGCPLGNGQLQGTGMQVGNTGGATAWLTTDAPIVAGETMQIELMVFDVSDGILDSLALLDNFRWNLQASVVGTHE